MRANFGQRDQGGPASKPPSTTNSRPVIHSDSSLARNSAMLAMSSWLAHPTEHLRGGTGRPHLIDLALVGVGPPDGERQWR